MSLNGSKYKEAYMRFKNINLQTIIIFAAILAIIAAVIFNIAINISESESINVFSEDMYVPELIYTEPVPTKPALTEEEWEKVYEKELNAADKAIEAAKTSTATLESELNITKEELEKTKADLLAKEPPELDTQVLKEKYTEVGELVTIDYEYDYIYNAKDEGGFLPWDTKEFIYQIPIAAKLGVDISSISDGVKVDDEKKTVYLTIPAAYLIATDPDEQKIERYDIQTGMFNSNPVKDEDLINALISLENELRKKIQENGILKYAQELAGYQIAEILQPITGISGYNISIQYLNTIVE
jgi:hypothetical protein